MRIIIFFLFLFSFSNSEYLITLEKKNNNGTLLYCIQDYQYEQNQIIFKDIENVNYSLNTQDYQSIDIKQGYQNNNGICYFDNVAYLGLDYEQFNYLMALYGIFLSSLVAYGLIKAY